jgi:predicted amidohydrolase YtcJ
MKATAAVLSKAADMGILQVDVVSYPDILDATDAIKPSLQYRNRYRVGGAKLTIDGSPQGKTAWLTKPYFVPPPGKGADYVGYPAVTEKQTTEAIDLAFANGWQILTHANGDAAIDALISAVRQATEKHSTAKRRSVLVHGQTCREDKIDSLKELGIIPSFFPMHTFYSGDWHRESVLGPERAENISPCGSALRRGMIFTSHHDAPVANPDSMRVLSATVTRKTRSGYVLGPNQRVSVPICFKAMTLWSAYQHFEEDGKRSIEVGKMADFVLLSDNPLTIDPDKLAGIKVEETIKEGVTVYERT